jgi:hypothetical protein
MFSVRRDGMVEETINGKCNKIYFFDRWNSRAKLKKKMLYILKKCTLWKRSDSDIMRREEVKS